MLLEQWTAYVSVDLETSDPPRFSVIHYPLVQNTPGSLLVSLLSVSTTNSLVLLSYVVGLSSQSLRILAAPSVIARGHEQRPEYGEYIDNLISYMNLQSFPRLLSSQARATIPYLAAYCFCYFHPSPTITSSTIFPQTSYQIHLGYTLSHSISHLCSS